ncbi:MAG: hypothetical protein HUU35_09715, partial [Armatimonadetes bacterium]|nr:hypothetical protein [Armatimonadota bacterium]
MRWAVLAGLLVYTNLAAALPGDRQRAENYYQRGAKAEALSDAAFKVWQQTIRVTYLDVAVDRWVYAVDQYSNATYYDPTHWRAHRRLGMLFAEAQGRHANDELALMHLVAYLALAPNDAGVARAKQTADARLARIQARIEAQKIHGEGHLDPDHAVSIGAQRQMDVYLASARSYDDAVKRAAATAQYAQTLPDMFAEQVYFNAELAERIAKRNAAAAP